MHRPIAPSEFAFSIQQVHKPVYHVDVDSVKGDDATIAAYNLTFAKYLSETAGKRFNPPITFVMAPRTDEDLLEDAENEAVDFLFSNPGIYSCIGVEYGAHPLVTKVTRATVHGKTLRHGCVGWCHVHIGGEP